MCRQAFCSCKHISYKLVLCCAATWRRQGVHGKQVALATTAHSGDCSGKGRCGRVARMALVRLSVAIAMLALSCCSVACRLARGLTDAGVDWQAGTARPSGQRLRRKAGGVSAFSSAVTPILRFGMLNGFHLAAFYSL